jgi:nitroreductase
MSTSHPTRSDTASSRAPHAEVDPLFVERWSPRSFAGERLTADQVRSLFEAARWAPSGSNVQPWFFVYADDEESLARARPLLRDGNRRWADRAPFLLFIFARRVNPKTGEPNRLAAFDTGAAWMALALQAVKLGLVAHAMGGVHRDRVNEELGLPAEEYEFLCGVAIGKRGAPELLPQDLQEREVPSSRKPTSEFARRAFAPSRLL